MDGASGGDAQAAPGAGGAAGAARPDACLACKSAPVEYRCQPCGCPALCVACARKMATGGKCKACKAMFSELKRL